jgi:hypothetical protein
MGAVQLAAGFARAFIPRMLGGPHAAVNDAAGRDHRRGLPSRAATPRLAA